MKKDNAKNDHDLVLGKGRSMAYFSTPEGADDKRKSTTCMHRKKHGCTQNIIAMRKLKAGRIRHMNQNKIRNINDKSWGLMTHEQRRSITSCTCGFCVQDVYHMIIECPRHKDEICNIMDTYKVHLSDEGKRKYEMLSHEKRVIKTVHLQNDYSITRLEHRKQIKATTKAWTRCIEKMEKLLAGTD